MSYSRVGEEGSSSTRDSLKVNFIRKEDHARWGLTVSDMSREAQVEPTNQIMNFLATIHVYGAASEDLEDFIRIFFKVQKALWYYEDEFRPVYPCLRKIHHKEFFRKMFTSCEIFLRYDRSFPDLYQSFIDYRGHITVCGAAILNESRNKCLLVMGLRDTWGFPKGKRDLDETESECAIREVQEEVGFDISGHMTENLYIQDAHESQITRLYIITDVAEGTQFTCTKKNEIKGITWCPISALHSLSDEKEKILGGLLQARISGTTHHASYTTSGEYGDGQEYRPYNRRPAVATGSRPPKYENYGNKGTTTASKYMPPSDTLYVSELPEGTTEEQLRGFFEGFEGFKHMRFSENISQHGDGQHGYTFIEFSSTGLAVSALKHARESGLNMKYAAPSQPSSGSSSGTWGRRMR